MPNTLQSYRLRLTQMLSEYRHAQQTVADEEERLVVAHREQLEAEEAQGILQEVAEAVQHAAHAKIAGVVARCLKAVFGDNAYTFSIRFEQKRGTTEAVLVLSRDGYEIDPTEAAGGGVLDVVAFALRLIRITLTGQRRLLVLDEPFKYVSANYREAVRELLLKLTTEMKFQIVLVTHDEQFRAGKVIEIASHE